MAHVHLTTTLKNGLVLTSPLWIASSHHSENDAAFRSWKPFEPAAITLKTCTNSERDAPDENRKRMIRERTASVLPRFGRAYYCDGPKKRELKSYEEMEKLLLSAKSILPTTRVGVSVLATGSEDFQELQRICGKADFWELNLKYSMRGNASDKSWFHVLEEKWKESMEVIDKFLSSIPSVPVFIKLSRELEWLPNTKQAAELLDRMRLHGKAGLIIANSKRIDVVPFLNDDEEKVLANGVMTGDPLFDSTIAFIGAFQKSCQDSGISIVATGGMVDEHQILMAMRAGADAIQLSTAFDYNGNTYYQTLNSALSGRIKWRGQKTVDNFVTQLRAEGIASVYNFPFRYFSHFWSDAFQRQIYQDIRFSRRMDIVLMSGNSVFTQWEQIIADRVQTKFRSLRCLHLNPESTAFATVQNSWGIGDPNELQVRRKRVRSARALVEKLITAAQESLARKTIEKIKSSVFDGLPEDVASVLKELRIAAEGLQSGRVAASEFFRCVRLANNDLRKLDRELFDYPEWGTHYYEKVPFYSMYLFDDKAYVSMYPFNSPGDFASPVYEYARSSGEYSRLDTEFKALWRQAAKGSDDPQASLFPQSLVDDDGSSDIPLVAPVD